MIAGAGAAGLLERAAMAPMTSMGVGGECRWLATPTCLEDLRGVQAFARAEGLPILPVGGGCNLLVRSQGFPGVVVHTGRMARFKASRHHVVAEAGVSLPRLIRWAGRWGLSGLENLAGIPGTVGGSVVMNAGGRHGEICDFVESVLALDRSGRAVFLKNEEIGFSYRRARGLDGLLVYEVVLRLGDGDPERVRHRWQEILETKRATQPLNERSSGCIFKNPGTGTAAGALIDRAGLKGTRLGGARVSERHANFIVNDEGATADDVMGLIDLVRRRVAEVHGLDLELEVKVI